MSERGHVAALIDVENLARDEHGWVTAEEFEDRLGQLDPILCCADQIHAAGSHHVYERYAISLETRPIACEEVPTSPDAADKALVRWATQLPTTYTHLVIVSGDHAFRTLSPRFTLEVVASPRKLSHTLRKTAALVHAIAA